MASFKLKALVSLSFLLLFGTYGVAQTSQGCVWTSVAANCDDVRCPRETVEITRGVAGICPYPPDSQVCKKGKRKLCCPRDIQLRKCEWSGTAPFCGGICASGKTQLAKDGWGNGLPCLTGCKAFCCEVLS